MIQCPVSSLPIAKRSFFSLLAIRPSPFLIFKNWFNSNSSSSTFKTFRESLFRTFFHFSSMLAANTFLSLDFFAE